MFRDEKATVRNPAPPLAAIVAVPPFTVRAGVPAPGVMFARAVPVAVTVLAPPPVIALMRVSGVVAFRAAATGAANVMLYVPLVSPTVALPRPTLAKAVRAACTCAAVALNARADVVAVPPVVVTTSW